MRARSALRRLARGRNSGGRLGDIGHDFDAGHKSYVAQLKPGELRWLETKPFSAPPSFELATCLRTFAHIVEELGLGLRAQVLDVGCGPGWLSEYLARCGYWATGVDISEDMVEIARGRVAAIGELSEGMPPLGEFHALPVRELPWEDRFDAAILYDTLHHFDDELETLRVIHRTLVPGGRIYIREGTRPVPGSESERALKAEMREYGTLESPFDPGYLLSVMREAGFEDVRRMVEIDELVDVNKPAQALRELTRFFVYRFGGGEINTVLARKPLPEASADAESFSARIEPVDGFTTKRDNLRLELRVTNTGRAFWPSEGVFPFTHGSVTVGPYVTGGGGERVELPRAPLPHGVRPGETVVVTARIPADLVAGHEELLVDAVREGVAWFSELGGKPLVVPLGR